MYDYHSKIARVNLSKGKVTYEELPDEMTKAQGQGNLRSRWGNLEGASQDNLGLHSIAAGVQSLPVQVCSPRQRYGVAGLRLAQKENLRA